MRPRSIIILFLIVFAHVRGYDDKPSVDFGRLPDDTSPEWYALSLVPDFNAVKPSIAGRVDISILVKTTTAEITLNSKDLTLHEIWITDDNHNTNGVVRVDSWEYVEDLEQVKIKIDGHILAKQKYTIHIDYSGHLNEESSNIFHTSYHVYQQVKKLMAANKQLQSIRARSAFPCYDEPHFKTPYNVSIKIKKNQIALSNMPILNSVDLYEPVNDPTQYTYKTWVHFIQTPPISTFMVVIFVGELKQLNKLHRNLNRKDGIHLEKYIMKRSLDQLNTLRNNKYAEAETSISTPANTDSSSTSHSSVAEVHESTEPTTISTYKSTTIIVPSTKPFYERPYYIFSFIFTCVLILSAILMGAIFFWNMFINKK